MLQFPKDDMNLSDYEVWLYDLGDDEVHRIKLVLIDGYGYSNTYEEKVKANTVDPIKQDTKPWVLTGKPVNPSSINNTFYAF